jgi:hypothetical protein
MNLHEIDFYPKMSTFADCQALRMLRRIFCKT